MEFNLKKNRGSFFFSVVLVCTCCTNFNYEGVKEEPQGPPATPQPIDPLTSPNGNTSASPEDPSGVTRSEPSDDSTSSQKTQLFVQVSPTDIPHHLIVCTKDQERFTMALYYKSKTDESRKFCSFRSHSKQYDPEKREYVESDGNKDGEENKDCEKIAQGILLEKSQKGWDCKSHTPEVVDLSLG